MTSAPSTGCSAALNTRTATRWRSGSSFGCSLRGASTGVRLPKTRGMATSARSGGGEGRISNRYGPGVGATRRKLPSGPENARSTASGSAPGAPSRSRSTSRALGYGRRTTSTSAAGAPVVCTSVPETVSGGSEPICAPALLPKTAKAAASNTVHNRARTPTPPRARNPDRLGTFPLRSRRIASSAQPECTVRLARPSGESTKRRTEASIPGPRIGIVLVATGSTARRLHSRRTDLHRPEDRIGTRPVESLDPRQRLTPRGSDSSLGIRPHSGKPDRSATNAASRLNSRWQSATA